MRSSFLTWGESSSASGLDKTWQIKYSWALSNRGFAVWDCPKASAECKCIARKQSHLWGMTMDLGAGRAALIREDQSWDFKQAPEGKALFSYISSSFIKKRLLIKSLLYCLIWMDLIRGLIPGCCLDELLRSDIIPWWFNWFNSIFSTLALAAPPGVHLISLSPGKKKKNEWSNKLKGSLRQRWPEFFTVK